MAEDVNDAMVVTDDAPIATSEMQQVGAMISAAVDKGLDADGIKALTETYVKMADRQAAQMFNAHFARFKAECPQPRRTAQSHHGSYAPLDEIERVCRPYLQVHGFSYSWDSEPVADGKLVKTICSLSHEGGHTKRSSFVVPITTRAGMGEQEKYVSAYSWGQRKTLEAVLGLISTAEAEAMPMSRISDSQAADLDALIEESGADRAKFLKHARVEKIEDILTEQFGPLVKALEQKRRAKG